MDCFSLGKTHIKKLACPTCKEKDAKLTLAEKEGNLLLVCEICSISYALGNVVYFTENCNPRKCSLECKKACRLNAFYFKKILPGIKSRRIHINESCTHCGKCADACPLEGLVKIKTPIFRKTVKETGEYRPYKDEIQYFKEKIRPLDESNLVPSTQLTFEYLVEKISDSGFLLDDGCGSQNFKAYLKDRVDADVFGVDVRVDHYAYYPINAVADSEHLPLKSGCVDFLVSNFVLEHATAPKAYLSEVRRVLKPDSNALLSVPTPAYHLAYFLCIQGYVKYFSTILKNPLTFLKNPVKHFLVERAHERDWSVDSREGVTFLDEVKSWRADNWRKLLAESKLDVVDEKVTGNLLSLNQGLSKRLGNWQRWGVHRTFVVE